MEHKENIYFYDIESLKDVFTLANYQALNNHLEIYYLLSNKDFIIDEGAAKQEIYNKNKNFNGTIALYDLHLPESNIRLAKTFGLTDAKQINDADNPSSYPDVFRIICDTDEGYDPKKYPYLMGYNSEKYDTTILTYYLYETFNLDPNHSYTDINKTIRLSNEETENIQKVIHAFDLQNRTKTILPAPLNHAIYGKGVFDIDPNGGLFQYKTIGPNDYPIPVKRGDSVLTISPPDPSEIRKFNNELFDERFQNFMPNRLKQINFDSEPSWYDPKWKIRQNMLFSGRHLDVMNLNETSRIGLKRILGMLGHQILESDKLTDQNATLKSVEDFYDLIAYNASDVINLEVVFYEKEYKSKFDLKKQFLKDYPDLIYQEDPGTYRPKISPKFVDNKRCRIDSTSASITSTALSPYGQLKDLEFVSYEYPEKSIAEHYGIKPFNVLQFIKDFFYNTFSDPTIRSQFDRIYNYYKSIEGKNFNDGDYYKEIWGEHEAIKQTDIPDADTNLFFYNKDGTPSSCYAKFSIGGIHGAETNIKRIEKEQKELQDLKDDLAYAQSIFETPEACREAKSIIMPNGEEKPWSYFLKSGSTLKKASWKTTDRLEKMYQIFRKENASKTISLNKRYVYTSSEAVIHEDFSSYYPLLLANMNAFYNEGLGHDRYRVFYDNKQKYGEMQKDPKYSEEEQAMYKLIREGTKLILNSATGAGAAAHEKKIKMDNRIISMRLIGQMFAWYIGQAQTLAGARIVSINTDGLYSTLDEETNNRILDEAKKIINVDIEPEPMYLISKDSNSRIELSTDLKTVFGASGGTLASHKKPNITKSLNHPAIIDWLLREYLIALVKEKRGLEENFDEKLGKQLFQKAKDEMASVKFLIMCQNIVSSSPKSMTYVFFTDKNGNQFPTQHYNRIFYMNPKVENTYYAQMATAKVVLPATLKKREREDERPIQHDPIAEKILSFHGLTPEKIPMDREFSIKKIPHVGEDWPVYIENRSLYQLDENELNKIIDNLNIDNYMTLLKQVYEENWKNNM